VGVQRARIAIQGAVQGVGFRPFVYRLATSLGLNGWVSNSSHGVLIEVEGDEATLREFLVRLPKERPPRSFIQSFEPTFLDPAGFDAFEIRQSLDSGAPSALVLPDIALCDDCRRELFDPADRRYRYPFINCTNCGPRFSIIEGLPYDRPSTTMRAFAMCDACRAEYENPLDRRFHAQPNACPECGPQVALWGRDGEVLAARDAALRQATDAIREGRAVAVKGLGGFHLVVDARSDAAVRELRARKAREEKPLALMYPSLDTVRADCEVSDLEERLLLSAEAPIVLLKRRVGRASRPSADVAPATPELGVMLPYTPLHHLLLAELGFPIVATSGNLSDEPICTDEREALGRLASLADLFLVHDRPIARHVDDSIARVVLGRELVLRRARGYAPLPVTVGVGLPRRSGKAERHETADAAKAGGSVPSSPSPPTCPSPPNPCVLAVGAHLKNTIAMSVGAQVFVSQHIGDLETEQAYHAFRKVIGDFGRLYRVRPSVVACDAHPDYLSTTYAREAGLPVVSVQHHEAHVLACMAENELQAPVLGVSWDGTGFGPDGTVWGGEFLLITDNACERRAMLRTFGLPGGDQAVKEPRRSALGLLYEALGAEVFGRTDLAPVAAFSPGDRNVMVSLLERGVHTPRTSSAGRLFDAVASILGLQQRVRFEGQAAMALQFAGDPTIRDEAYPMSLAEAVVGPGSSGGAPSAAPALGCRDPWHPVQPIVLDWAPMLSAILEDLARGVALSRISARFHNGLVDAIVRAATGIGCEQVALTGGCFQNAWLLERAVQQLRAAGLRPYWHQRIPPNDGGIALGQVVAAFRHQRMHD
jgi:hydrogenase maturation protein HypF